MKKCRFVGKKAMIGVLALMLWRMAFAQTQVQTLPAPHWVKIPLLSPEAKQRGIFPGGEGGQWPRGPVAVSPADPNFLLLPIDVGGLYRSLDGGEHWEICMVGWNARGANHFAIDPYDSRHIIGVGGNGSDWGATWGPSPNGLYLSTDKAASWKHVLAVPSGVGGVVAFDPHTYEAKGKRCTVAYFLSPHQGLFRSDDGGKSWARLGDGPIPGVTERDWKQGGTLLSTLTVEPKTGVVYAGGATGLFRSTDQGRSWSRIRQESVYGLALASNGIIYVSGTDKIVESSNGGATWTALPSVGLDTLGGKPVQNLAVSPADPRRLLCWVAGDNYQWTRYLSRDGGATFTKPTLDNSTSSLPHNARQGYLTWSPTDPNVAWGLGGDWVTKSTDGGRTFHWSNNGNNGIMVGGLFNFSSHDPETVFLSFQDYNGAFTNDGGRTWNYRDVSGKGWGGYEYGGYAVDRQVMWCGDAESWGGTRHLRLSRNGGKTWDFVSGFDGKPLALSGPDVSFSDPADASVLFAGNVRSGDRGATWQEMSDCDAVYTADSGKTSLLYGRKGEAVVRSTDHGQSWQTVADGAGKFSDIAVDSQANRIYVASQDRLKVWQVGVWKTLETPRDQYGSIRVQTVAVDPQEPRIVYVGGPRDIYASHATICRSMDGGTTWQNLTVNTPLTDKITDGPHEVSCIRVHPVTRWAWVAGQCFGLWKIAPPSPTDKGVSAALASAPLAPVTPSPR